MKIGIIFGGNSLEHEISIITAYQIKNKIKNRYAVIMLYVDFDNNLYDATKCNINNFKETIPKKIKKTYFVDGGIKKHKLDAVIIAGHGENAEDGLFAGVLRFYNIPFIGSNLFASSLCINKYLTYLMLSKNNIPMLKTNIYTYDDYKNGVKINEFPIILKPINGGSSMGIKIANDENELLIALSELFKINKEIIYQSYYSNLEEYNMAVYYNGVSALERINNKSNIFTFENKYTDSFKLMHQEINNDRFDEFKEISQKVYKLINANGIIRIDFFIINNEIYVNEVNTIPGALAMYLFDDFNEIIDDLIKRVIINRNIKYNRGNFLATTQINKWFKFDIH